MPFAEISFEEKVGNSNLTLAEVGCFDVADCNLLEKVGVHVDPPTLNTFYTQHKLYSYDATDHANDDINFSTVTHYCPQLVANPTQTGGFPNSDLAIVEFRYKSHTGAEVTHFCAVNNHADQSIIDSYDGKVKTPAQYQDYYGHPVAWATYDFHGPNHPSATAAPAAPVSVVKAAAAPAPHPAAPTAPKQLYLPPSIAAWHVYKPGGPYTLPYAEHVIDPKMFNGLTYNILGSPAPNVYLIKTQDYGEVAIYAGPDTVAQFPGTGHGEGEVTPEQPQGGGVPVNEVVAAPAPAPAPAATDGPQLVPFDNPQDLLTKNEAQPSEPTPTYDPASGQALGTLPLETQFKAIGKYETPYGVFFTDGSLSVKTVDLQPDPNPTSETTDGEAQAVDVRVVPAAPDAWKLTLKRFLNPVEYRPKGAFTVHDLEAKGPDVKVSPVTEVMIGGTFKKDGVDYYISQSSIEKSTWYGFPLETLLRLGDPDDDLLLSDLFDPEEAKAMEVSAGYRKGNKTVAAAGTAAGLINRLRGKK